MKVGVLLFDGVAELDAVGPLQVLDLSDPEGPHPVTVVAGREGHGDPYIITGDAGLNIKGDLLVSEAPPFDLVVVPGGPGRKAAVDREDIRTFLQTQSLQGAQVLSVCTGAFLLAAAGLLCNRRATTHHASLDELERSGAVGDVVRNVRFVEDGPVLTTAGVTAGIDGALALLEKRFGEQRRLEVALQLEYPG